MITRKQDGGVPAVSVLRTLPKTYRKHPSSAMVVDDDSRVSTKKMAGKQVVGAPLLKSVHPYQFARMGSKNSIKIIIFLLFLLFVL